jgi:hypothetical protein
MFFPPIDITALAEIQVSRGHRRLRDEFAMAAMQALITGEANNGERLDGVRGFKTIATAAYAAADAMLEARIKKGA